jgi:hypothetical protein
MKHSMMRRFVRFFAADFFLLFDIVRRHQSRHFLNISKACAAAMRPKVAVTGVAVP